MFKMAETRSFRRHLFVGSNTEEVNVGPLQPFSSYQSLFKRRNQSLKECFQLKPELQEAWTTAQKKIESKLTPSDKEKRENLEKEVKLFSRDETEKAIIEKEIKLISSNEEKRVNLEKEIELYGKDAIISAMVYSTNVEVVDKLNNKNTIYGHFNSYTRAFSNGNSRYKINLIDVGLMTLFENLINMQEKSPVIEAGTNLYRGFETKHSLNLKIGQTTTLGYFVSTSKDFKIAYNFLENSENRSTNVNKRFIFEYSGPLFGIDMKLMSEFAYENEILLFPYQSFIIVDIAQNGSYTIVKFYPQTEKAVMLLSKISLHFPDLAETLQLKTVLNFVDDTSQTKAVFTLVDDTTSENYMISSTDLKHFSPSSKIKLKHTNFDPFSLPNSHIFVYRQLIDRNHKNFSLIKRVISFFPSWAIDLFEVRFITLVPNIYLLEASINKNSPFYCKIQTEVYRDGQPKYTEEDCFLYRLSLAELNYLHNNCTSKDAHAISFIISKKDFPQNREIFYQKFKKEDYSLIKVAHVDKHWDTNYKDNWMVFAHADPWSFYVEKKAVDGLLLHVSFKLFFGVMAWIFTLLALLGYNLFVEFALGYSLAIIFSFSVITCFALSYWLKNMNLNLLFNETTNWFLCEQCDRRCNGHCYNDATPRKRTIMQKLFPFLYEFSFDFDADPAWWRNLRFPDMSN